MNSADNILYIVGTGSGREALLTAQAREVISSCRYFAGGRRPLALVPEGAAKLEITHDLEAVSRFIDGGLGEGDVCVLTSGDPGCFSILPYLMERFGEHIRVLPGISSVQLLAAAVREPWESWSLVSLHGRRAPGAIGRPAGPTVYFCDRRNNPRAVAESLSGMTGDCRVVIGSDLGTDDEEVWEGTLYGAAAADFPGNSLLLVVPAGETEAAVPREQATAPGIPDDLWLRREGIPLSKSEVRAVLLSKAQPAGRGVIWDVGAGTGSYGVECALLEPAARVLAIDRKREACELARENAARFGARVETVCGEAPAVLASLPAPDLAIIGGNDGRLGEIFERVKGALRPGGRLVVTALLPETRKTAHGLFAHSGLVNRQATRVAIARGRATRWDEHNPVIIFNGDKE